MVQRGLRGVLRKLKLSSEEFNRGLSGVQGDSEEFIGLQRDLRWVQLGAEPEGFIRVRE